MTITLTKDELSNFQGRMEGWTVDMIEFIVQQLFNPAEISHNEIVELIRRYEKEHPRPTWKNSI